MASLPFKSFELLLLILSMRLFRAGVKSITSCSFKVGGIVVGITAVDADAIGVAVDIVVDVRFTLFESFVECFVLLISIL